MKVIQGVILGLVLGFVAGLGVMGWRLSALQADAAEAREQFDAKSASMNELISMTQRTLDHSREMSASMALRAEDYAALKSAAENGAIDLELAPEIEELLTREWKEDVIVIVRDDKD